MPAPTFPEVDTAYNIGAMAIGKRILDIFDSSEPEKVDAARKVIDKFFECGRGSTAFEDEERRIKDMKKEMAKRLINRGNDGNRKK